MTIWEPLPDKVEQKFKKELITWTLGNILTMVMVPTPVSAVLAGPDHDQNVPKGPGDQLLFEFLLYLIRKWFPDDHASWGPPWCRRVSTMIRMFPRVQGIRYLWNFQATPILGGSRHPSPGGKNLEQKFSVSKIWNRKFLLEQKSPSRKILQNRKFLPNRKFLQNRKFLHYR